MAIALAEVRLLIEASLPGAEVEVSDQTGSQDHLEATVTAAQFEGLSRIDQHRLVKKAVQARFDDGSIHALTIKTSVPG
ncbi:MAG TPA: BolA/IbaG family iron-sulfur metabolism protein [Solirubrobacterales bacterium]|jgi:stress-induced morphogen|nr:BolA/IbaG family iron-sulfur metabolism protein [Solirubrobacterales bacterium]